MKRPPKAGKRGRRGNKQRGARRRARRDRRARREAPPPPSPGDRDPVSRYAAEVVELIARPIDTWAVAATLESQGLRDIDAQERWGYPDLFAFADAVYARILTIPIPARDLPPLEDAGLRVGRFLRYMFEGSFFAMPMIGQILCLFATRYSLWASLDFTEEQATLVGLGTLASFAISGALVMTIGRQGTVYQGMEAYSLLRRCVFELASVGLVLTVGALLAAGLLQVAVPFVDLPFFALMAAYFTALCLLWLALAALYMLQMHAWNVVVTVAGAALVAVAIRAGGLGVHTAQILAITGCAAVAGFLAWRRMSRLLPDEDKRHADAELPRGDVLAGMLFPFGIYGLLYFSLLFADRVLAWTAPDRMLPRPIWFHTPYELGLDWALISLLLPMSFLEYAIRELGERVAPEQDCFTVFELDRHRRRLQRFAWRALIGLLTLSVLSTTVTFTVVRALQAFDDVAEIRDFFASPVTTLVYWPAAIGYQLLTVGLLAALVSFMWARPLVVVRNIGAGLLAAVVVGFVTSRLLAAHWAVLGFTAGTATFAGGMVYRGYRVFRDIDFYYYSAY